MKECFFNPAQPLGSIELSKENHLVTHHPEIRNINLTLVRPSVLLHLYHEQLHPHEPNSCHHKQHKVP